MDGIVARGRVRAKREYAQPNGRAPPVAAARLTTPVADGRCGDRRRRDHRHDARAVPAARGDLGGLARRRRDQAVRLPAGGLSTTPEHAGRAALTLGALGVVFGDIGTSPLYAVQTVFSRDAERPVALTPDDVYGVVSLIFWAVTIIVTF